MPSLEELIQTTLKDSKPILSDREAQCLIDAVSEYPNAIINKLPSKSNYDDSKDPVQPLWTTLR